MIPDFANQSERGAQAPQSDTGTAAGLLRRGQAAARGGDRVRAVRLLRATLIADPTNNEAKLWLAAIVEDAQEAVHLLTEVLQEEPDNVRAADGLRWACERLEAQRTALAGAQLLEPPEPIELPRPRPHLPWRAALVAICAVAVLVTAYALVKKDWSGGAGRVVAGPVTTIPGGGKLVAQPTATATATTTPTVPTATPTNSPTSTPLPTATATSTATATPTAVPPTATKVPPSPTAKPAATAVPPVANPGTGGEKWIEVNLTAQTVIAWEGNTAVRRFVVATGKAGTPTVTGEYRIYVKLVSTPMSGPGYNIPNVPYTMYFYKGYALHGAPWVTKFGYPQSHGCVNFSVADAQWLFNWATPVMPAGARSVYSSAANPGTRVVIHK